MTTWLVPMLVVLAVIATALVLEFGIRRRLDHGHDGEAEPAVADAGQPGPGTDAAAGREARFERVSSPRA